ncbi:MAG TPA: CDP-alcohol phosphatidyltransferase family protein [Vicinamibacterales bacterium]|nr:CDP-alcohol phosphatidyltransferase family protein [Vicinamibacterales bacterium]
MSVLTAANQLTLLRLLLVPVFVLCMLYGRPGWALVTFAVAAITDALDGLLARRSGPTTLGAWLDPMADKLLLAAMFIVLTLPGLGLTARIPIWLTVLVISRDIAIVMTVAIFNLAVARRTFKPSMLGKVATATYLVTGVVTLYANYDERALPLVPIAVYLSAAITIVSGFEYLFRMRRPSAEP